jgi:aryl-alcohol dehydrogenase-like predicted oxidoreductase
MFPRYQGENLAKNVKLVERIESIAADRKTSPAALVLAWLLAQGDDIVPLFGTKRRTYLEENVAAAELELPREVIAQIAEIVPKGAVAGQRYSDMSHVNR